MPNNKEANQNHPSGRQGCGSVAMRSHSTMSGSGRQHTSNAKQSADLRAGNIALVRSIWVMLFLPPRSKCFATCGNWAKLQTCRSSELIQLTHKHPRALPRTSWLTRSLPRAEVGVDGGRGVSMSPFDEAGFRLSICGELPAGVRARLQTGIFR